MDSQILVAFVIYFLIILTIGVVSSRRKMSEADFVMGGRGLNFWLTALSAHASDMSAWLFMAFPAVIFVGGVPEVWIALGLLVGMYLNWQFVAPELRRQTENLDSYTLSTFFERRFRDRSGILRVMTALLTLFYFSHYLAALLMALGKLLAPIFEMDYYLLISIATLVMVVYTYIGGYVTVAWVDLFQATFLLFAILFVPVMAFFNLQNPSDIIALAEEKDISLHIVPGFSWDWIVKMVSTCLGWGLAYFGMPHVLTKFMGIKNPDHMWKSKYLGMTWMLLTLAGAAAVGLIGIAFFPTGLSDPQFVFIDMAHALFHPLLAGIVLCAVMAANLSTMDSQILCCATVISEDLYRKLRSKPLKSGELLWVSRLGVVLIALVALVLSFNKDSSIINNILYPWSGLGCSFGPLVLLALYSKRTNRYGAIAGVLFGGVFAATWPSFQSYVTSYNIAAIVPGFPLALLLAYTVSRLTEDGATVREMAH